MDSVAEVVSGRADFAIGSADLLVARDRGKPVVTVATNFYESAAEYFIRRNSGFGSLTDLSRLRVARRINDLLDIEFQAMLLAEGLDPNSVKPISAYGAPSALASGVLDLIPAYSFVTPYILKEKGVDFISLRPREFGINFYGDSLFAREDLIRHKEETVKNFIEASLRGWQFALENPEEIADQIAEKLKRKFPVADPAAFNRAQIEGVRKLTLYPLIEPGHINPGRWQHMHRWLKKIGLISKPLDIDRFIYNPLIEKAKFEHFLLELLLGIAATAAVLGVISWIWFLRRAVASKTEELLEIQRSLIEAERMAVIGESNARYRDLIEGSNLGIQIGDNKSIRKYTNRACLDLFGYESEDELIVLPRFALVADHDRERVRKHRDSVLNGETDNLAYEYDGLHKDGRVIPMQAFLRRIVWEGEFAIHRTLVDLSDRKKAEEALRATEKQLQHAQKLEAIGQLTGGVAHDFNNLLTVILGSLDFIARRLDDEQLKGMAKNALDATSRGADLTQRLLAFSRKQALAPKVINLNESLSGMIHLMRTTLGETVHVEVRFDDDLWSCSADPGQLENAILNLAISARDAMPKGGQITIETSNVIPDDDFAAAHPGFAKGDYVMVSVSDTGKGIPQALLDRVFEPFFTTKDIREGSGLGLSMVYGFIKQSGGELEAESEDGEGATIRLYLPRSVEPGVPVVPADDSEEIVSTSRGEKILVVEDQADVRAITVDILVELGYEVAEATKGSEAIRLLQSTPDFHLLLTDLVLPGGMNGVEATKEARRINPDIKVLFITGYAGDIISQLGSAGAEFELLRKLFDR